MQLTIHRKTSNTIFFIKTFWNFHLHFNVLQPKKTKFTLDFLSQTTLIFFIICLFRPFCFSYDRAETDIEIFLWLFKIIYCKTSYIILYICAWSKCLFYVYFYLETIQLHFIIFRYINSYDPYIFIKVMVRIF